MSLRPRLTVERAFFCLGAALLATACGDDGITGAHASAREAEPSAQEAPSVAAPDRDAAFPQDRVPRIDIVLTPASYRAMQDDMTEILGAFGSRRGMGGGPPGAPGGAFTPPEALFTACAGRAAGVACEGPNFFGAGTMAGTCTDLGGRLGCLPQLAPGGGGRPGGPPGDFGLGTTDLIPRTPRYVEAEVRVDGKVWKHVGVRYKGNSSLAMTWSQGSPKLPLRLNFDKFEDDHPEIKNQTFHGFDSLSLSNNMEDPSLVRGKVANDVFRRAGVPAPASAFYRVYFDGGAGPQSLGIYTAVELPSEDAFLDDAFGSHEGNLYKPSGTGARFETYEQGAFEKENNTSKADWSDVESLHRALHAERSDAAAWREGLEAVFDVDGFLHWLAVNTVIQNWDAYGRMPHNYYLYANPSDDGRLSFIPWDQSYALSSGGFGAPPSLGLGEVGKQWPLIRYLLDDPRYREIYHGRLRETVQEAFEPARTSALFRAAHALVAPHLTGPDAAQPAPAQFESSFAQLLTLVAQRQKAVEDYLAQSARAPAP